MSEKRISDLTAASSVSGTELVEISQLSSTITITGTTLSALAADNSYNDSANGFLTAGFLSGDRVKVTGFTGDVANNIFVGVVTDVVAGKLTIGGADGDVIVDDAAGESVTISKWTTRRTTVSALAAGSAVVQGTHTIPVPAAAMVSRASNGPSPGTTESTTNKVMSRTLDFDKDADEFAQISIPMPKSWNEGTVLVQPIWTSTGTGDVVWAFQAQYQRDDDPLDGAWGSAISVTDTVTAANDRMVGAFSSAITPAGTGGNECSLLIQVSRDADNVSDTCTADAKLLGIRVKYTVNAGDDS